MDIDQIIQQTSPGWRPVGDPVIETQMATDVTGAQKPTPTGRYLLTITDGTHSRQIVLRPDRIEGPTGRIDWQVEEGPKDVTTPAPARPTNVPASPDQRFIISRNPDGTLSSQENPNYKGDKGEASQLQPFGDQLLRVAPDGTVSVLATKSGDAAKPTTVTFGDTLYSFDGTKVTPLISKPKEPEKPLTEVRNGVTYQWNPATQSWSEAVGLPAEQPAAKPATASTNTGARWIVFYDDKGNETSRQENPNFQAPIPTQLTPDAVSANIPLLKPDGTIEWVPNQNRVPASAAMQGLLEQVGVKVNAGELSMADAKDMLTGSVNAMNAQTARMNAEAQQAQTAAGAAQNILSTQAQGAQTGAGMLAQRQQTATNLVQQGLGVATSTGGRYGNYSGGMLSPVPGLGQALASGAANYATELGGGQAVYDTAVRMVQAADPNNQNPDRAAAVATLTQLMDRYKQASGGQDHPAVAATKALNASTQNQGLVAPANVPPPIAAGTPPVVATTPWQRADQMSGATPMGNALASGAGLAGTVVPGAANYLGSMPTSVARTPQQLGFTAPGAIMGILGPMAMARG